MICNVGSSVDVMRGLVIWRKRDGSGLKKDGEVNRRFRISENLFADSGQDRESNMIGGLGLESVDLRTSAETMKIHTS